MKFFLIIALILLCSCEVNLKVGNDKKRKKAIKKPATTQPISAPETTRIEFDSFPSFDEF